MPRVSEAPPLLSHQREGIEWIHGAGRGLLADEPGLGKSRTAIEAFDGGRVLVVAPSMVLAGGTWDDELERWAKHPEGFTVAPYSMLNARTERNSPNFGTAKNPKFKVRDEFTQDWDAVILDEAHYVKSRNTSWTVAVDKISQHSDNLLALTGTPMPNWAHELFTLLRLMYPDEAHPGKRYGSYHRWLGEWFVRTPNRFNPRAMDIGGLIRCHSDCSTDPNQPCEHWQDFTRSNVGDRFLRRLRDDVLDLPPLTESTIWTPMDAQQKRMYRELKKDWLTHAPSGEEVVTWTTGSRHVLLDKITTSGWMVEQEGEPVGGKFDRLRFDLENRSRPTLVLAHYRETVEACARVAESLGATARVVHGGRSLKDKGAAVAGFKAGKVDVLVGSLETLAEGLTLTSADMAIFVEKSYKPSRNEQALRRVHRIGQTRPVTALDYTTPASIDKNKRELLREKTDQQIRVLKSSEMLALA